MKKILIKTLSERASETRQQKMILFSLTLIKIIFPVTQLAVYKECVIFVVCKMVLCAILHDLCACGLKLTRFFCVVQFNSDFFGNLGIKSEMQYYYSAYM